MVARSKTFRDEVVDHDLVHDLCDAIFLEESGAYWMSTSQLIEIGPGNKAQELHRELDGWHPFIGIGPSGPEIFVTFLTALSDFTEENGATRVIPNSNHWPDFDDRGTPEQTVPALMNKGDTLMFSAKTAHGGGANTTGEYRRGVSFALCPSYLAVEEPYPFLLDLDLVRSLPRRVQKILGFRSQWPKGSPGIWTVDYKELADYLGL